MSLPISRRALLAGAAALAMPAVARAQKGGSVTAAIYPGAWEDAFRDLVAPALLKAHGIELEMQALFAVDQVAKFAASRGAPPFDCFVLDPGPRATAAERGMFEKFDASKLSNRAAIPAMLIDDWGIGCNAQVVGIAYNPKKLPKPKGYADLFKEPWVSRLGITGFGTTFGTVSLIEIAKVFGGSETNVEPALVELKKVLPKIAAVSTPAALPGLLQQGQCDITYTNTQTVTTLKDRGVDIEFAVPETGATTFLTTLHIAKGCENMDAAYKYIDTVVSKGVQDALQKPPYNFIPVNKEVALGKDLPMKSLDEMSTFVTHDWSKINPLRAQWIERFNREMAK
ncbi:extracellular solute-binding protein [Paracraurococcus lichenis]|uniref:Extracellular solute-binding protein n=1 Tax=Paracraurococcus lichenis TaxID=3064888 RepID=A0ABT9E2I9_9PROT|nr:extracellular solute-binding protein [Paracraurococcus sp. LOR1-02]MDO9710358.1 extracellular solute-binding protein [Paracraurococcus sp. LOR1-02]